MILNKNDNSFIIYKQLFTHNLPEIGMYLLIFKNKITVRICVILGFTNYAPSTENLVTSLYNPLFDGSSPHDI